MCTLFISTDDTPAKPLGDLTFLKILKWRCTLNLFCSHELSPEGRIKAAADGDWVVAIPPEQSSGINRGYHCKI